MSDLIYQLTTERNDAWHEISRMHYELERMTVEKQASAKKQWDAACAVYKAELERLTTELENERAKGIHSCGPNCQRPMCVLRRENERLTAVNKRLTVSLAGAKGSVERQHIDIERFRARVDTLDGLVNGALHDLEAIARGRGAAGERIEAISYAGQAAALLLKAWNEALQGDSDE